MKIRLIFWFQLENLKEQQVNFISLYIDTDFRDCEIKRIYPDFYEFTNDEKRYDVLP